ncbi:MAG: hypothetical protein EOO46_20485, partial [Flavobacterium sp.]
MKSILSLLTLVLLFNFSSAQNKWFEVYSDSTALINDGEEITKDFQKKLSEVDKNIDLKNPKSQYNLMGPFYAPENNTINLSVWNLSPQWYKDFCIEVAGGKEQGEKMFGLFFNGIFAADYIIGLDGVNNGIEGVNFALED